jgi:predicted  nucleic acid-binding Zn-ribbon protein
MQEISLAKALQVKNRLAEYISKASSDVAANNSHIKGASVEVDVQAQWQRYCDLQERLVDLKDRISEANRPVQADIYRLAELKGRVSFLKTLPTTAGALREARYTRTFDETTETVEYEATIRKAEVDEQVRQFSIEIDNIQERLDGHNHQTRIEFDLGWM